MQQELEAYFDRLWPICRSITGDGLRASFKILQELIPLKLTEVPTGRQVFDWNIPKEWNIEDAYILDQNGEKIVDFKQNNLHVLGYSIAVDQQMSFQQLKDHLYYLEDQPNAIPYRTSYYKERWGFCLSYETYKKMALENGTYRVVIQSSLKNGSLTYADCVLKGQSDQEILLSSYLCHPSMANNELSGPLLLSFLYQKLSKIENRRYTYRFVIAPETIGVVAYLAEHAEHLKKHLHAGLVATCIGDAASFTYKRSKEASHEINRIAEHILKHETKGARIINFAVGGSDERQYCSPGFNFAVGSLMRSMYHTFEQYHTSLDNKSFISFKALEESVEMYLKIIKALELNQTYKGKIQYCEPQLGKRGLYPTVGALKDAQQELYRRLHLLSFADGKLDLLSIAEQRSDCILDYTETVQELLKADLIA